MEKLVGEIKALCKEKDAVILAHYYVDGALQEIASTSLIQRRLSLGYGRAAKLIDEMEKRGIVSPPEGQKPRSVLISPSEWHEICVRSEQL